MRKTVKVSLDKVQRSGVRTEKAQSRVLSSSVRAAGTVEHDESLLTVITVRSDGYVEELFVNKTGQHVKEGEPLFQFYSPQNSTGPGRPLSRHARAGIVRRGPRP